MHSTPDTPKQATASWRNLALSSAARGARPRGRLQRATDAATECSMPSGCEHADHVLDTDFYSQARRAGAVLLARTGEGGPS